MQSSRNVGAHTDPFAKIAYVGTPHRADLRDWGPAGHCRGQLMVIGSKDLIDRRKATASTHTRTGGTTMPDDFRPLDKQPLELIPDNAYESWHEFREGLAYRFWVQRGRPLGSPEVDWRAAERAVYESLVASGRIAPSPNGPQGDLEEIYRRSQ